MGHHAEVNSSALLLSKKAGGPSGPVELLNPTVNKPNTRWVHFHHLQLVLLFI